MHFNLYNVSNLRNDNVTEVRLIVNMPFKWHNVERHAHIDDSWIIICRESYVVWIPITQSHQIDSIWNAKYLNILWILSHCEVVCGRRWHNQYIIWKGKCSSLILSHYMHQVDFCRHVMSCVCVIYLQALRMLELGRLTSILRVMIYCREHIHYFCRSPNWDINMRNFVYVLIITWKMALWRLGS